MSESNEGVNKAMNQPNADLGREIAKEMKYISDALLGRELAKMMSWEINDWEGHGMFFRKSDDEDFSQTDILCESLDAIAEIENLIDEKGLRMDYYRALQNVCAERWIRKGHSFDVDELECTCVTATARQRAEALLLTLKSEVNND